MLRIRGEFWGGLIFLLNYLFIVGVLIQERMTTSARSIETIPLWVILGINFITGLFYLRKFIQTWGVWRAAWFYAIPFVVGTLFLLPTWISMGSSLGLFLLVALLETWLVGTTLALIAFGLEKTTPSAKAVESDIVTP